MDSKKIIATALAFSGLLHGAIIFYYTDSSDNAEVEKSGNVFSVGLVSESALIKDAPDKHPDKPTQLQKNHSKSSVKNKAEKNRLEEFSQNNTQQNEQVKKPADVSVEADRVSSENNKQIPETEDVSGEHKKRLLTLLHDAINANKKYPYMARRQRREGRVKVNFMLHPNGKITDVYIVRSSHYSLLDAAAKTAVESVSPFRSDGSEVTQALVFDVDVDFRIN